MLSGSGRYEPLVPAPFEAAPQRAGADVVIAIRGEFDVAGGPALSRAVEDVVSSAGERVVVDLAELSFIDASGIHALGRAYGRLRGEGKKVVMRDPQPRVLRLLQLCGINEWQEGLERSTSAVLQGHT
jgi:anti-sigma B factor antagonist